MPIKKIIFLSVISIIYAAPCISQSDIHGSTCYKIEAFGSAATDKYTPFHTVSNKYGIVPLEAGNAYLQTGVFHNLSAKNGFQWSAGLDIVTSTPRYRNAYIQQLYAAIRYKFIELSIGSRENYTSLWDRHLSSGDFVMSANARPIPEVNLSVPQFTPVPFTKGIFQFKGNFAVGRSFDSDYLEHFADENQHYMRDVLWHNKSLHIKLIDPQSHFPVTATLGIRHHAQWGGVSSDPEVGAQSHSMKDFINVLIGKSGGEGVNEFDVINVLGNHYGSYEIKLGYLSPSFDIFAYKQHYFDDASGIELYNIKDGLYGIQANIHNFMPLNKVVFEFANSRDQSGPVHYIVYDHDKYPAGYGGGADDYYNNFEYLNGVSYFNRSLGSPLLTSPEYNKNGELGFKNNRIRAFHLGFQGYISKQLSYRILATSMEGWGTPVWPLPKKDNSFSCAAKLSYRHPHLDDWIFSGEIAGDFGSSIYGDNTGISISATKTGILKKWY